MWLGTSGGFVHRLKNENHLTKLHTHSSGMKSVTQSTNNSPQVGIALKSVKSESWIHKLRLLLLVGYMNY